MALITRLFDSVRGTIGTEDEEVDYWAVRWMPWDSDGGYRSIEEWDGLDEPVTRQEFEWNVDDPEPGRYRLFAVRDKKYVRAPEKHRWKWEVGNPTGEADQDRSANGDDHVEAQLEALKEVVEELKRSKRQVPSEPEVIQAQMKARVLAMAVQNPVFMARHGDKLALAALDTFDPREYSPAYEDWKDDPMSAMFFELSQRAFNEPESLRLIGESLGTGIQRFKAGVQSPEHEGRVDLSDEGMESDSKSFDFSTNGLVSNGESSSRDLFSEDAEKVLDELDEWDDNEQEEVSG